MSSVFWITVYLTGCIIVWIIVLESIRTKEYDLDGWGDLCVALLCVFLSWGGILMTIVWGLVIKPVKEMVENIDKEEDDKDERGDYNS